MESALLVLSVVNTVLCLAILTSGGKGSRRWSLLAIRSNDDSSTDWRDCDDRKECYADGRDVQVVGAADVVDQFAITCANVGMRFGLTPREGEVLQYLAKGYNCKSTADALFISEATVKSHCFRIYKKMGIHSQQEIIIEINREAS